MPDLLLPRLRRRGDAARALEVRGGNSHWVWPAPLDKQDTPAGRILTSRDYTPPGSSESVPTLGTWPLLYELGRDPAEAYNVAETRPEIAADLGQRLEALRSEFLANPRGWIPAR